jgi:hypothetical protein
MGVCTSGSPSDYTETGGFLTEALKATYSAFNKVTGGIQ